MNSAEYEKLCEEAFGTEGMEREPKPEAKPEAKAVPKPKRKSRRTIFTILAAAAIVCAVLAGYFLTRRNAKEAVPKPTFLQVVGIRDDGFYGMDINGDRWRVVTDVTDLYVGGAAWITFEGEPQLSDEVASFGPVLCEVSADRCWSMLPDGRVRGRYAYDICEFDYDRDGTVEQCILSPGPTSGLLTYELSFWDGDTCERSTVLQSGCPYTAFFTDGGNLKILGIYYYGNKGWEFVCDIAYEDGTLIVKSNGTLVGTAQPQVDIYT